MGLWSTPETRRTRCIFSFWTFSCFTELHSKYFYKTCFGFGRDWMLESKVLISWPSRKISYSSVLRDASWSFLSTLLIVYLHNKTDSGIYLFPHGRINNNKETLSDYVSKGKWVIRFFYIWYQRWCSVFNILFVFLSL